MKKMRKKCIAAVSSFMMAAMCSLHAFAAEGDVDTTEITTGIDDLGDLLRKFGPNIFFVLLVLVGVALMFGESGRRWGKTAILFGVIGFLVVTFAPAIVSTLQSYFPS